MKKEDRALYSRKLLLCRALFRIGYSNTYYTVKKWHWTYEEPSNRSLCADTLSIFYLDLGNLNKRSLMPRRYVYSIHSNYSLCRDPFLNKQPFFAVNINKLLSGVYLKS